MNINIGPFHQAYYADQMRSMLRSALSAAGSQKELAKRIGITPQFLNDMLNDRRAITGKALSYLGFEQITVYYRIGGDK